MADQQHGKVKNRMPAAELRIGLRIFAILQPGWQQG